MPRPAAGYSNRAGQKVPGVNDPLSRFMDQSALKHWAYKRGCQGLPLYERSAIDIGSTVHGMAELDLKGRPDRQIEMYAHDRLTAPEHLQKAWASFRAFRDWRQSCHVRAISQEASLVSETYQYGGTIDTVAVMGNGLAIIDFKTGAKPYPEHLLALAAYTNLWNETHPDQPITAGAHLIVLPKDGAAFQHHAYGDLSSHWRLFQLYLEAYRLDRLCKSVDAVATTDTMAALRASVAMETKPIEVKPQPKPRVRVKATTIPHRTMGEILRAYGHIPQEV